jgi:catechol 2,3-dioxygenase-like lactoylglutathione lyase family enzyme
VQSIGQINYRTCVYATETGKFLVMEPFDGGAASFANGGTISFAAASKEAVDSFHAAGLANGDRDEGAPGPRPNAPGNAYGAYLRDPVGNKICAFAQLPE